MRAGQVSQVSATRDSARINDFPGVPSAKSRAYESGYATGLEYALQLQFDLWCKSVASQKDYQSMEAKALLNSMKLNASTLLALRFSDTDSSADIFTTEEQKTVSTVTEFRKLSPVIELGATTPTASKIKPPPPLEIKETTTKTASPKKCNPEKGTLTSTSKSMRQSRRRVRRVQSHVPVPVQIDPFLILPDSTFRICWDFALMLLILFYAAAIPVRMAFNWDPPSMALENLFTVLFLMDILFNFNTGVYNAGILIVDRKSIAELYL
jgi:hypothetical protein